MKIRDAVTAFIMAEPETSFPKRAATILVPRATIGTTALLALTALTAAGHGPLPQQVGRNPGNAGQRAWWNRHPNGGGRRGAHLRRRKDGHIHNGENHQANDRRRRSLLRAPRRSPMCRPADRPRPKKRPRPGSRTNAGKGVVFAGDEEEPVDQASGE